MPRVSFHRTVKEPPSTPAAPIYIVTVLDLRAERHHSRTWGWFPKREEAEDAVLKNATDMFEAGYYTHAVVEERPPGILVRVTREDWYQAVYAPGEAGTGRDPTVTPCAKPSSLARVTGFGMG